MTNYVEVFERLNEEFFERYTTGTGQKIWVHKKEDCRGDHCVIHNPSAHSMRDFPTHWRNDRKLMERICPHGIGHPDPDDLEFKRKLYGDKFAEIESVHGCDGCCADRDSQLLPSACHGSELSGRLSVV